MPERGQSTVRIGVLATESVEHLQRYTQQLDDQENRLEVLRREIATTTGRRDAAERELNVLIGSFTYEG